MSDEKRRGHEVRVLTARTPKPAHSPRGFLAKCRCQWRGPVRPTEGEAQRDGDGHLEWIAIPREVRRELRRAARRDTPTRRKNA